jgi:hypothetical protein
LLLLCDHVWLISEIVAPERLAEKNVTKLSRPIDKIILVITSSKFTIIQ